MKIFKTYRFQVKRVGFPSDMTHEYKKALILAGGQGTRLRRFGEILPKCLVPIYDQPLFVRLIEQCARAGVEKVYISISSRFFPFLEAVLKLYTPPKEVTVNCLVEEVPLGAIGGFVAQISHFLDSPSIVILGDEYYEENDPFDQLKRDGLTNQMTIGIIKENNPSRIDCNVQLDAKGRVNRIIDKPSLKDLVGNLRWCGLTTFHPDALKIAKQAFEGNQIPGKYIGDLLEAIRRKIPETGTLEFKEVNLNVNNPDDILRASLLEARKRWKREYPEHVPLLDKAIDLILSPLKS